MHIMVDHCIVNIYNSSYLDYGQQWHFFTWNDSSFQTSNFNVCQDSPNFFFLYEISRDSCDG